MNRLSTITKVSLLALPLALAQGCGTTGGAGSAGGQTAAGPDRTEQALTTAQSALNEARAKLARLEGKPPPAPLGKGADRPTEKKGRSSSDPELQGLMRRMIQKENDEAAVRRVAEAMTRWAGDDAGRRRELAEYCRFVVGLGYGTEAARKALKHLAGE